MSFVTSLFQSRGWQFVEELASPLLKSPEWNFAQEVAANPLNQNVKLESAGRLVATVGKIAFDPNLVFTGMDFEHQFAEKLLASCQELEKAQIVEVYYKMADLPTPFHMINRRLVASVKIVKSSAMKIRSIEKREMLQKRGRHVQANQNDNFNAQIRNDISDWNGVMQKKLMTIFLSCIAFGAIISVLVIKATFVAFAALAAIRLLQLYSLQKKNLKIIHVGHWVAQLWQAFSLNPMLRRQYGQYYDNIFFSEPPVLKIKAVEAQIVDDKTAEKKEIQPLKINDYFKFGEDFKKFANLVKKKKCETAEERHQWMTEFLKENPFNPEIFRDNPSFQSGWAEEKWKKVAAFRFHFRQLQQQYGELSRNLHRLKQYSDKSTQKCEELKNEMEKTVKTVAKSMKLDSVAAEQYQKLLLQIFEAEYLSKIKELGRELDDIFKNINAGNIGSLAYPQAQKLFEQACKGLIKDHSYTLDPVSLQKMVPSFQQELIAISKNHPQTVIKKAESLSPDSGFHAFVDQVFKPN